SRNTMNALWQWSELSAALSAQAQVGPEITRIAFDSRQVKPGDLFVALPGDPGPKFNPSQRSEVDGHAFLADAKNNGAAGALVQNLQRQSDLPQIVVENSYDALWQLGRLARRRLTQPVVAITGSSGKTTAKRFLAAALGAYAPPGSLNNHIGVPLSLANADPNAPAWVFEVGTNHPGEIEPLTAMVKPHCAILLNVHSAHIENFSSRQALIEEKCEIFSHMQGDELRIAEDTLGLTGYKFGLQSGSDAQILNITGDRMEVRLLGRVLHARLPGGGDHRGLTLAATLLATALLEVDLAVALELPDTLVPEGRGNLIHCAGVELIDDSYNANPASMKAALQAFANRPCKGHRYVLLGEMLELGDSAKSAHQEMREVATQFDGCFFVGSGFSSVQSAGHAWFTEAGDNLLDALGGVLKPGDSLLIKGSNRVFWAKGFVPQLAKALNTTFE
ncbi:MAG: UDP-N-acetylmuramoyl-tripeptide--D-alanyl-D-alanine ligase, partial [Pseudomonadales bacterium]